MVKAMYQALLLLSGETSGAATQGSARGLGCQE